MKTSAELAEFRLDSPDAHKKRAAVLRRLSGGLDREIKRADASGLSRDDVQALQKAEAVLDGLAKAYAGAGKLAQARWDAEARMEKAIRLAMADNFNQLALVPDRVALIAAVKSHLLRNGTSIRSLRDLDFWFRDALDSLAYTLAVQAKTLEAKQVVHEAWEKFSAARGDLVSKHLALVGQLALERGQGGADPDQRFPVL